MRISVHSNRELIDHTSLPLREAYLKALLIEVLHHVGDEVFGSLEVWGVNASRAIQDDGNLSAWSGVSVEFEATVRAACTSLGVPTVFRLWGLSSGGKLVKFPRLKILSPRQRQPEPVHSDLLSESLPLLLLFKPISPSFIWLGGWHRAGTGQVYGI